jgi:C4-dicarboxylate-specific signal transduction histidine kinase
MITTLLIQRRRLQVAELESRGRLLEVIHLGRTATAGVMSASIAHELNQPLGSILGNAEAAEMLLSVNPIDVDQLRAIVADIQEADQHAAEIIRHLRGLLKKKSEMELQEFGLNTAVEAALNLLKPEVAKRDVELRVHYSSAAMFVSADHVHLQQVIMNLAMNGMDAMQNLASGSRRLTFRTVLTDNSEAKVSISDSGPGIPTDKLTEIFDTFYTTKQHGTGLGLSIARTIVELYGGRLWAENRSTGGAAFHFTLPLVKAHAA